MRSYRPLRVGSLIQEELNKILLRELDLKSGTLVTISNVKVSSDLSNAKIGISVIPSDSGDEVMVILSKLQGRFQHLLNHKLNIRPMPRIEFERDFGLEKAANIERLLKEK